ncbi:MAG: nicotinamide mononucleotide transporter [Chloroflexi bacterium]|nr:nicotinamide mononucleotide transporter [Chloroflexota bacterium]
MPVSRSPSPQLTVALYVLAALLSVGVVAGHWLGLLPVPLDATELLAFVTGAWTVWLAARNNVWNWPIGVANSALFVVLFFGARLYFDMSLNVFYVLSGLWGWWAWTYGGAGRTEKPIGHVGPLEAVGVLAGGAALTALMWHGGILLDSAAPALDAITTGISVVAQWLLMRRFVENWYAWIAADIIYVPMYVSRELPLTAVLYAVFLLVCLRGLVEWRAIMRRQQSARTTVIPALAVREAGA